MTRFPRLVAPLAALTLVAVAAPALRAQEAAAPTALTAPVMAAPSAPAPAAPAVREATPVASATLQATPVALTRSAVAAGEPAADVAYRAARAREAGIAMQAGSRSDGKLYMIVGGAAFLAGAIIGDDAGTIIMIGGAAVGIYGLYLYLR